MVGGLGGLFILEDDCVGRAGYLKYSGEMKSIDATCSINFEELDSSTLLFIVTILNFFEILLLVK